MRTGTTVTHFAAKNKDAPRKGHVLSLISLKTDFRILSGIHRSLGKIDLSILHAEVIRRGVMLEEDVNVVSFDAAALILGNIDLAVDDDPGSLRNDPRVRGDGVVGLGSSA